MKETETRIQNPVDRKIERSMIQYIEKYYGTRSNCQITQELLLMDVSDTYKMDKTILNILLLLLYIITSIIIKQTLAGNIILDKSDIFLYIGNLLMQQAD